MQIDTVRSIIRSFICAYGFYELRVCGTCMDPTVKIGECVNLIDVPYEKVRKGDIVAVEERGRICLHRVLNCKKDFMITKGDSSCRSDYETIPEKYVAYYARRPFGGLIATISSFQSNIFLNYLKYNKCRGFGTLFRFLIRLIIELNCLSNYVYKMKGRLFAKGKNVNDCKVGFKL